jgi:hypothetical protein
MNEDYLEDEDEIEAELTEGGVDYVLMPSHPAYKKEEKVKVEAKPDPAVTEADGAWILPEEWAVDSIEEPAPTPRVTGSITLPNNVGYKQEQTTKEQPAPFVTKDSSRALKPVDEEYSGELERVKQSELWINSELSRRSANILAHAPKSRQQRYLAIEQSRAQEALTDIALEREVLGGEIYAKLDDDTRVAADNLREMGLGGIHAAKVAQRHSMVEKLAGSILTEADGNPQLHNALVEKLYGAPQRDTQTGEIQKDESGQPVRLGGLVKTNRYGALDVTNEDELEQLYKDAEASRAYRRSPTTQRAASRASAGGAKEPTNLETPRLKALRGQRDDLMGQSKYLMEGLGRSKDDPQVKELFDQIGATHTQINEESNLINARENVERGKMGMGELDTIPDQKGPTIQKNAVQLQNSNLKAKIAEGTKGLNDADARTKSNEVMEKFAKDNGKEIIKPKNTLDLVQKLAAVGEDPQITIYEGDVGAKLGLKAGFIDRSSIQKWANDYATPENKVKYEKQVEQSSNAALRLSRKIRQLLPDAEFDSNGFVEGGNYGPHARLVANHNQMVDNARVAGDELKAVMAARDIVTGKTKQPPKPTSEFTESRYSMPDEEEVDRITDSNTSLWN